MVLGSVERLAVKARVGQHPDAGTGLQMLGQVRDHRHVVGGAENRGVLGQTKFC